MSSRFLSLVELKSYIDQKNSLQAQQYLENVSKFFEASLSKAELDLAIEVIFNIENGTLAFLNRSIRERRTFSSSNIIIFNIWINIIVNHGGHINFEAYVEDIIQCCMQYIISTQVSAKEKEKSVIVLQEVFKKKLVDHIDASEVVGKLLDVFNLKVRPTLFTQEVFRLLGLIARDSPENICGLHTILVRNVFIKAMEDILLKDEQFRQNVLTGAMEGLCNYLITFPPSVTDEQQVCQCIYVCIKKLANPIEDISSKGPFRAALDVFTKHSNLFCDQIYKDFKFWHDCLTRWISSKIYEDRRKGLFAVHSFHKTIEEEIVKRKDNVDLNIIKFLMDYFRGILESYESKPHETRIAIRGFGMMALSCKIYLPETLDSMLSLIIQRTELISISEDNELRDSLEHFPDYIEALSQIIVQLNNVQAVQNLSHSIQSIIIRLIRDFHYLSRAHTALAGNSVCTAFYNLSVVDGYLFEDMLEKVILQGVIWTCSHKLVYDANLDWENNTDWKENITYKSYLPLWENILDESVGSSIDKSLISQKIFNHLMGSLFTILEKLDLRTKRRVFTGEDGKDQEFYFCDPNIDLCPERSHDFHIFFNLVDFYRDIFYSKYRRENFRVWINEYCSRMIKYAIKNPLISGFLKLLESGLSTGEYLEYFVEKSFYEGEMLKTQLSYFLKSLIEKSEKVSGELQISLLELILKYPSRFYSDYILDLIPVFQTSLDLGKSMIWLANLTIECLEKISDKFSEYVNDFRMFCEQVLPKLDTFLQSKGFLEEVPPKFYNYKNRKRIRRSDNTKIQNTTDLFTIQKKIINLLGKLDPQNAVFVVSKNGQTDDLVKWHIDQNVRLTLNFPDIKPQIYLDTIVPRVCHLAITSSDRKTKIAACEIVHTLVLYLLGTRNSIGKIWKVLCGKILILGADGDETVKQMFEPLLMQLMHFLSKHENLNMGVDILMEALMDGISNTNCSIRDLSAVCLREFVEWSIKQTQPQELAASSVSIEMILEQFKIYSFDSNTYRRIGAALAFNNLYRNLRESESVCDLYFIDLLYTFCVNYKLTEELCSALAGSINSDLEQVSLSLDHIVRVLKERNYLYDKIKAQRKVPSMIGNEGNLTEVVMFLLSESGSKLINYRRKCLQLCANLAPHIANITSLSQFLTKNATKEFVWKICEGLPNGNGIKGRPNLQNHIDLQISPHLTLYNWLQYFLSSLDCYAWFLGDNALQNPEILFQNCRIFDAISYYLSNLCWNSMYEIIESINQNYLDESSDSVIKFSIEEMNKIESIKCIVCVQMIDFFISILHSGCAEQIPNDFWTDSIANNMIKYINQIIYEPHKLQFDFKSEEIAKHLPTRIEKLLKLLKRYCPNEQFISVLGNQILSNLIENVKELSDKAQETLNSDYINEYQLNSARGIILVMKNLEFFEKNERIPNTMLFLKTSGKRLIGDLFQGIKEKVFDKYLTVDPPPDVKTFANQLMRIAFTISDLDDDFMHYILNENELKIRSMATKISHGEHFFNIYRRAICEQCKGEMIVKVIPQLLSIIKKPNFHFIIRLLQEITIFSYKYRQYDQTNLETLVKITLSNFAKLFEQFTEKNENLILIEYLMHLAKACPIMMPLKTYKTLAPTLQTWIVQKLKDKSISLEEKSRTITLLPLLIGSDDINDEIITDALQDVQRHHFPLRSSEFLKNSLEEIGLKSALKSLLDAMICSESFIILDFIIKSTAADQKHILEYMIREYFRTFMEKLSDKQQLECLKSIFESICKDIWEPQIRLTILERFLLPVMHHSTISTIVSFYEISFGKINNLAETVYGFGKSGWKVEHAIVNRIIGFSMIEIFFGIVPKVKYYYINCPLLIAYNSTTTTPNSFLSALSRKAFFVRQEIFVTDNRQTAELFRVYQCAAYRAVCSIVCNTQTKLDYYTKFLFQENLDKNEYIWKMLIDCNDDQCYVFEGQELEKYPKIKERFVSIRRLNEKSRTETGRSSQITSSKYLQTQHVFASSLSQDVNKIDMNYSMVRTDIDAMTRREIKSKEILSVELERHALNKHEIMPTLCGAIQHMHENKIHPTATDPKTTTDPKQSKKSYPWVVHIANAIGNRQNHKNIRIFLSQLVDNCRNVFEQFAHILFQPLLEVLCDECGGNQLNFFITDIIALLLSWTSKNLHKPTSPDEIRLTSQLLNFMMKNAWSDKSNLLKFNLELIQTMISLWKDTITIPVQLLLNMITKSPEIESKDNECGIILMGIVLANELIPWTDTLKVLFIRAIFSNLNNNYTAIYQPAANVLGMILAALKRQSDIETVESIHKELVVKLKGLVKKKENTKDKTFMDILFNVHKNFPEILDSFRETVSYKIPSALGAIKKLYLEMLLTRLDAYDAEEIYYVIVSIGIRDLLNRIEFQLLGLHILNKSLAKLQLSEIENLFPKVESCTSSSRPECRDVTYEILIFIAQNLTDTELSKKAEILLLQGLLDTDSQIQNRIFQYWSQDANLSSNIPERFIGLIKNYSATCENQFLGFCTQLILEPAIQSKESKDPIFPYETDNKLVEYAISTNSRMKTSFSLPPLFSRLQQTWSTKTQMCNFIRNTGGEYFFEATQDPGKMSQIRPNFTLPTQSCLPFGLQPQVLDRRSQKLNTFEKIETIEEVDESMDMFRKRFHKDKEQVNRERSLKAIDARVKKSESKISKSKEGHVTLFRRYRHGNYPDLSINSLAFLLPLQGLVKRDRIIARQVFVLIFNGILEELGVQSREFIVGVGSQIQNIFENCKTCDSTVFATFLEIALLKPEAFNIKSETVSMIAKASNMLTIGAVYLENRLNSDFDDISDNRSVKSNTTITTEEQHWLELSDIYSSLNEFDVVVAIFSDKLDTDPRLAQAIEMKSNGRYSDAQELLLEVINQQKLLEQNYSYNCYYECFVELGDWSLLSQAIHKQIDSYEELWSDEYNTNFCLPKLMQAEVNLILQGNNGTEKFLRVLESWMGDPVKADYLKTSFCEELMMLHIANQDYLQARVYCENYMKKFLIEWGITSSHYQKLREQTLLNTHKVIEIDQYALLLIKYIDENILTVLVKKWTNCEIDKSNSLRFWNSLFQYRAFISTLVSANLRKINIADAGIEKLEQLIYKQNIQFFNAAIHQENLGIVDRIMEELSPLQAIKNDNLYLEYEVAQIKREILCEKKTRGPESLEILEQAWMRSHRTLNDANLKESVKLQLEVLDLNSQIGEELLIILQLPTTNLHSDISKNLFDLTGKSQKTDLKDRIFDDSLNSLKDSAKIVDSLHNIDSNLNNENSKIYADAYFRLAEFCYDHYQQQTDLSVSIELQTTLIKSVLEAMKYNSQNSKQLFACVLQIPGLENNIGVQNMFTETSTDVPDWMFLTWIPQLLSRIKLTESCYLDVILERIAKNYPNALKYPFNVWYEGAIKQLNSSHQYVNRDTIQNCIQLLSNPLMEKFIISCKNLCIPQQNLSNYIGELLRRLKDLSQTDYIAKLNQIIKLAFDQNEELHGSEFRKILHLRIVMEEFLTKDITTGFNEIRKDLRKLFDVCRRSVIPKEIRLENLCPWLAKYHWCGDEESLELPGQYTGEKRPFLENQIKIVKFGGVVGVYESKRNPIKMKIYCSNGKSYDFLIKSGEDLRQDQRIQQILTLMSNKLKEDESCRNHNLFIRSYQVIPMQHELGMISFVNDTMSMHDFVIKCLLRREPNGKNLFNQCIQKYKNFILQPSVELKIDDKIKIYGNAVTHYTRDQIIQNFRAIENLVNLNIIKYALTDVSVSPESFYVLRNNWSTSLASMSIAHWILGIGDRHLDNVLISSKNASLTGIDFDYAFGAGTRNLGIPELIPFRLTPHFVHALNPMGSSGILFKCMQHTLSVFRNSKKILLPCMEVFVKDPTMDWLVSTNKFGKNAESKRDWEPKDRVDIAKLKLSGSNPTELFEREIRAGSVAINYPEYMKCYINLLRGHKQFNIRARLSKKNLTVEEQVQSLIDLASDPAVLGCTWEGFCSWF